jgi:hypothetical protein
MPACTPTHKTSQLVQGPGVCCAALGASGITAIGPGTRVAATDKNGKCFICEVKNLKKVANLLAPDSPPPPPALPPGAPAEGVWFFNGISWVIEVGPTPEQDEPEDE